MSMHVNNNLKPFTIQLHSLFSWFVVRSSILNSIYKNFTNKILVELSSIAKFSDVEIFHDNKIEYSQDLMLSPFFVFRLKLKLHVLYRKMDGKKPMFSWNGQGSFILFYFILLCVHWRKYDTFNSLTSGHDHRSNEIGKSIKLCVLQCSESMFDTKCTLHTY